MRDAKCTLHSAWLTFNLTWVTCFRIMGDFLDPDPNGGCESGPRKQKSLKNSKKAEN